MKDRRAISLSYGYTPRLIGPISYPGECDLMVHPQKYSVTLLPSCVYNMHQDTKSARLIAVCKRTFTLKNFRAPDGNRTHNLLITGHTL